LLKTFDFLEFCDSSDMTLVDKIRTFENHLQLLPTENKEELENELAKLSQKAVQYLMMKVNDSTKSITFDDLWKMVELNDELTNITYVVKAAKVIPVSSAAIEQAFSIMNIIKTDEKSQLSEEALESL